jgi:hypothetical protein
VFHVPPTCTDIAAVKAQLLAANQIQPDWQPGRDYFWYNQCTVRC